jgi:hypothetical protein
MIPITVPWKRRSSPSHQGYHFLSTIFDKFTIRGHADTVGRDERSSTIPPPHPHLPTVCHPAPLWRPPGKHIGRASRGRDDPLLMLPALEIKPPPSPSNLHAISPVRGCGSPHQRLQTRRIVDRAGFRVSRLLHLCDSLIVPSVEPMRSPLLRTGLEATRVELQVSASECREKSWSSGGRLSGRPRPEEYEEGGGIEEFFGQLWWVPLSPSPRVG